MIVLPALIMLPAQAQKDVMLPFPQKVRALLWYRYGLDGTLTFVTHQVVDEKNSEKTVEQKATQIY